LLFQAIRDALSSTPTTIVRLANIALLASLNITRIHETLMCWLAFACRVKAHVFRATSVTKIGNNVILALLDTSSTNHSFTIYPTGKIGSPLSAISLEIVIETHGATVSHPAGLSANFPDLASVCATNVIGRIAMARGDTPRGRTKDARWDGAHCSVRASFMCLDIADAFLGFHVAH